MIKNKQTWEIEVYQKPEGLFLAQARRLKKAWISLESIPAPVLDFCNMSDKATGKIDAEWTDIEGRWPIQKRTVNRCYPTYLLTVPIDFPPMPMQVAPEVAAQVKELEDTLRGMNDGRNDSCWPLVSFGWKDADLDPEGCTGIKKVVGADRRGIVLEVGGHKTVCDPTYESEYELTEEDKTAYSEVAHSIVCDGPAGEWTGDDWCLAEHLTITVQWRATVKETAEAIIRKARKAVRPFERSCKSVDKDMDRLYAEIREKYEKAS